MIVDEKNVNEIEDIKLEKVSGGEYPIAGWLGFKFLPNARVHIDGFTVDGTCTGRYQLRIREAFYATSDVLPDITVSYEQLGSYDMFEYILCGVEIYYDSGSSGFLPPGRLSVIY